VNAGGCCAGSLEPGHRPGCGSARTRTLDPLHQAAGDKSEHRRVPILGVIDQGASRFKHVMRSQISRTWGFHLLALAVLVVKLPAPGRGRARGLW